MSTLAVLRSRILDRSDQRNSDFPDTTLNTGMVDRQINASIHALYDLLLDVGLFDIGIRSSAITAGSVADEWDTPTDFYRCIKLIYEGTDGTWTPLPRTNISEIDSGHVAGATLTDNCNLSYMVWSSWVSASNAFKNVIKFSQTPLSGGTFRLYYAPILAEMTLNTHTVPLVIPLSWEDWIVNDVAAYLLEREESDPSGPIAKREKIEQAIKAAAANRYLTDSHKVRDVYRRFSR